MNFGFWKKTTRSSGPPEDFSLSNDRGTGTDAQKAAAIGSFLKSSGEEAPPTPPLARKTPSPKGPHSPSSASDDGLLRQEVEETRTTGTLALVSFQQPPPPPPPAHRSSSHAVLIPRRSRETGIMSVDEIKVEKDDSARADLSVSMPTIIELPSTDIEVRDGRRFYHSLQDVSGEISIMPKGSRPMNMDQESSNSDDDGDLSSLIVGAATSIADGAAFLSRGVFSLASAAGGAAVHAGSAAVKAVRGSGRSDASSSGRETSAKKTQTNICPEKDVVDIFVPVLTGFLTDGMVLPKHKLTSNDKEVDTKKMQEVLKALTGSIFEYVDEIWPQLSKYPHLRKLEIVRSNLELRIPSLYKKIFMPK